MSTLRMRSVTTVLALSLGALLLPTAADSDESEEPRVVRGQHSARHGTSGVRTSGPASAPRAEEIQLAQSPLPLESFRPTAGYTFDDRRVVLTGDTRGGESPRCAVMGLDAAGTSIWALRIRGQGDTQVLDLAPAHRGAVLITGHMERQGRLGDLRSPEPGGELASAFAAIVDQEGKGRWLPSPVTGDHRWSVGMGAASLADGRLLVVGEMERMERRSVFTCAYSADGTLQQLRTLHGELEEGHSVPIAPMTDGGFLLARCVRDSTTRRARAHLSCHGPNTTVNWDKALNEAGSFHITGLAATPCGGAIATGYAFGAVRINGRDHQAERNQGTGFVIALAASGKVRWVRRLVADGEEAYVLPLGAHVAKEGNVQVVCLGHGSVREAHGEASLLKLTTGHFLVTHNRIGSLVGGQKLGDESDGELAVRIPGARWLGLADLR